MSFFAILDDAAKSRELPYLIIGGYAVIAHGFPRLTFDFDIAIERARQKEWLDCVGTLGYAVYEDGGSFLQPSSRERRWPLDLMLLNETTFMKLFKAMIWKDIEGRRLPFDGLFHLLALKVHSLRHTRTRRFLKDFEDVTGLVRRNKINLAAGEIREILTSMEHRNSTKKCNEPASGSKGLFDGVDFPVAPDFQSVLLSADLADVYRACEAMLATYLSLPGERERRREDGIRVEFIM